MEEAMQDKPQDLSMKSSRKVKPIPPPLDLNARTLDEEATDLRLPKSPGDLPRECLPIRKRPLVEIRRELHTKSPKSVGSFSPFEGHAQLYAHHNFSIDSIRLSSAGGNHTAPCSPLNSAPPRLPYHSSGLPSTLVLTPSSATSSSAFTHFPVPPPLIPAALAAVYAPKSPYLSAGANGFPTPPTELHSPYPWASPSALASVLNNTPFSPGLPLSPLPFSTSSLLSPAPSSYPSSTNSSREDLPIGGPGGSANDKESKRRLLSAHAMTGGADSSSPIPNSPLLSPRTWSHNWPTPAWQCFISGTLVRFLLPNTETPWQKAEELGWKDHIALKVDSRNPYQYAPHGLTIVKIDVISRECSDPSSKDPSAMLRLRLAPHRMDNTPEILAECHLDHPFFIKEKGWSSAQPRMSVEKYGIPCQDLSVGDICLPPNHPEAVRTPDLCDRFRRFEFSTDDPLSPLARPMPRLISVSSSGKMSPPSSPAKKKEKDNSDKPKRPMNGFMLFAKKFRLELIQQHPGKDNRAISVLLGEAWKSLPPDEREQYSQRAKLLADEQKKMFPDCWKRKRTLTTTTNGNTIPTSPTVQTTSSGFGQSTPPSMLVIRQDLMAARESSPLN